MTDAELRNRLRERIDAVRDRIAAACRRVGRDPAAVTLVAVTKTVSARVARAAVDLGVADLGESRPQVLWKKAAELSDVPIRWHMIGHLQRNKVEETLPHTHLIHSVDSVRLFEAVAAAAKKQGRRPRVLLQMNVSREEQKHGFDLPELLESLPRLRAADADIVGLMGMAAAADDPEAARPAFAALREFRDRLRDQGLALPELSMGMSGDFEVAVEEGATLVRIGSTIFEGLEAGD